VHSEHELLAAAEKYPTGHSVGRGAAAPHAAPAGHTRPLTAVMAMPATAVLVLIKYAPGPPAKAPSLVPIIAELATLCETLTTKVPVLASAVAAMAACAPALPTLCGNDTVPLHGTVSGVHGFVESADTVVPGHTPKPERAMVLASTPPSAIAVTVREVPEMKPVTVAAPSVKAVMGTGPAVCGVAAALAQVVVVQGGALIETSAPVNRVVMAVEDEEDPTV